MANGNASYTTLVSAEPSSLRLEAVLLQIQPNEERPPLASATRSLAPVETRYPQTENEVLALTWPAERFGGYIIGLDVVFENNHKPRIALMGKSPIDLLPTRIQHFRIKLMRFNSTIRYMPGTSMITADVLSRAPLREQQSGSNSLTVSELTKYVKGCVVDLVKPNYFEKVKKTKAEDEVCQTLVAFSKNGWPKFSLVPGVLRPYWQEIAPLTVFEGVLLNGRRLVIPQERRD